MLAKRGRRCDPAKEILWRGILKQQRDSGLSVRAFCDREGLKAFNLFRWRRELSRRDRAADAAIPNSPAEQSTAPSASPVFLPVRVIDDRGERARPVMPIEVLLPDGPIVRVPVGFDPRTLGDVLAVLEGRSC
jgi:transposase